MATTLHTKFAALSHPNRLDIFRLLMRRFPDALPAGQVARVLNFPASTTSTYLSALRQAGLIEQYRSGTSLQYRAALPAIRGLFDGLVTDCCQNRPDLCLATEGLETPMQARADGKRNVLFICSHNAARSIMAEALLETEAGDRFNVFSAGIQPQADPNAETLQLLAGHGHAVDALACTDARAFAQSGGAEMDIIITVCDEAANTGGLSWTGRPLCAHWSTEDPLEHGRNGAERRAALEDTYAILRDRIRAFATLPFDQLDRADLQHRLDAISYVRPAMEPAD